MDENYERQRYCPRCLALTRHERHGWRTAGVLLATASAMPCFWPVTIPLTLALAAVRPFRPLRCNVCGRASWGLRGEPGHYPDTATSEATVEYDTIRLVRRAAVGSEAELIRPITRIVRAIQAEGRRFRLYGRSPSHKLHRLRTVFAANVWRFVSTSEIQWNFGRQPQDPTHVVVFFNLAQDAPVFLKVRFVLAGHESMRPGLDLSLSLHSTAESVRVGRTARLDRLFSRLVDILRPDFGRVELHAEESDDEPPVVPAAGWLTYLARPVGSAPLNFPPPMVATPLAGGLKITLTPGPAPESAGEIAAALSALDGILAADPH